MTEKIPFAGIESGSPLESAVPRKRGMDTPIAKPKQPCSCCGRLFQPTDRRRMLCINCYKR